MKTNRYESLSIHHEQKYSEGYSDEMNEYKEKMKEWKSKHPDEKEKKSAKSKKPAKKTKKTTKKGLNDILPVDWHRKR